MVYMDKEKDIEKTVPIDVLTAEELEEKVQTRTKKYTYEEEEAIKKTKQELEAEEQAEEALAEKNIAKAEGLLDAEKKDKKDKKEKKPLTKKQKITIAIGLILLIILIVALAILLRPKKKAEPKKEEEKEVEVEKILYENYYYEGGSLHFIDRQKNEIGKPYECKNKDENLCYVAINNYRDNFDIGKKLDEEGNPKTERMPIFDKDYVFIYDNADDADKRIRLWSIQSNELKDIFYEVKGYDGNLVVVKDKDNKYGLIQLEDGITKNIEPQYSYLGMIDNSPNLIAKNDRGYFVVSKNGEPLSKIIPGSGFVRSYSTDLVATSDAAGHYTVYDYDGKVLSDKNKFATVDGRYLFLVDSKNQMYIKDIDGTKYQEEGIQLSNDKFVPEYTYTDNKLTDTKKSFMLDVRDKSIQIGIYDTQFKEESYIDINI